MNQIRRDKLLQTCLTLSCVSYCTLFYSKTLSIKHVDTTKQYCYRARKLYTSARIYEWKFGKGEWKLPFASPTGRVDFFGFVIIFEEIKKELTSMFYSLQKQHKHSEERLFGRFKMSLKCDH